VDGAPPDTDDVEPLSWVLGEIHAALTLSSASLQEAVGLGVDERKPALSHAAAYLHQAHGALLILEVRGVAMVSGAAEELLVQIGSGLVILTEALTAHVDLAFQALYEYLDELIAGAPQQPVRLYPYYRNFLEAMGAERIHPADLFCADLSVPALPEFSAAGMAETMLEPSALRQRYEKSLLHFLKSAEPVDALPMSQVAQQICQSRSTPAAQAFWWVVQGFTEAVATRQIPIDMLTKQLLGRINQQLRKLGEAGQLVNEGILRDALFYVARADQPGELQRAIRAAYGIDAMVPADFEKQRYGLIDVGALNIARERLAHAKGLWARLVHGDMSVVSSFEHDMDGLVEASGKLNAPPLARLVDQLDRIARQVMHGNKDETLCLEIATALLVVESALLDIRRLPEYFAERTDAMSDRLRALAEGSQQASSALDELDHSTRHAQQQAMATLAGEMQAGLQEVERLLDEYFRHEATVAALVDVVPLLHQIEGALAILNQDAAVRALQYTQQVVSGFSDNAPPPEQYVCENLAQNIGALGMFMEALRFNPVEAKKHFVFNQDTGVFVALPRTAQDRSAPELTAVLATLPAEPVLARSSLAADATVAPAAPGPADAPADLIPEFKQVGPLRISLPLYLIYAAETRELLHTLSLDLFAARQTPEAPIADKTVQAAHSLAGSAATVGLGPVYEIAAAFEAIVQQLRRKSVRLAVLDLDLMAQALDLVAAMMETVDGGQMPDPAPQMVFELERIVRDITRQAALSEAQAQEARMEQSVQFLAPDPNTFPADAQPLPQALLVDAFLTSQFEVDVMSLEDTPDPDLLPIFIEEARDILPQIGRALRDWRNRQDDPAPAKLLLRLAHTVKGSARMAGAMRIGQHMHHMEARVENCQNIHPLSAQMFDELMQHHDRSLVLFEQLMAAPLPDMAHRGAAGAAYAGAALPSETGAVAPSANLPANPPANLPGVLPAVTAAPLVRVRADILDRLVNQAGEVSISRSRLESEVGTLRASLADLNDNVQRLRAQLREVELQADSQVQAQGQIPPVTGEGTIARDFDALEFDRYTRLQELTRMMAESVEDVGSVQQSLANSLANASSDLTQQGRMTRDLQQDLMRVRMVQFGSLSDRLYRVVRQTAKEQGKRVNLDIRGAGLEVDRSVLDRMVGPFEHLLRNAIVHGIEPESIRRSVGKRENGDLGIDVRQEGNEVVLQFSDDGDGLDLAAIRTRAIADGLLAEDSLVTDAELVELIFHSGFSTAEVVTENAGRGIGMDAVRAEAASLGGTVAIQSDAGQGTCVTIRLPLTLAVTQVVLLVCGGRMYALPSALVEQVVQLKHEAFLQARREGAVQWQGQRVEMVYMGGLLAIRHEAPLDQSHAPVIILRNGTRRLAVHVDEIIGNREVVVKNTGPQLAHVVGIAGATVLGTGEIVVIINPLLLAVRNLTPSLREALAPARVRQAVVMVVDDSLTVRRVSQRMLVREGYQVILAKDGVEALQLLQDSVPDVMLLDIEMPRMDGFELLRSVRGNPALAHLPVLVITSRTAAKHRDVATALGVDGYFGKPFSEGAILEAIAGILQRGSVTNAATNAVVDAA
jgi:chemotaxis protein histidine kinase CheA/AmiR/NasT family two-component response regulator